jgi:lipopolysaccharide transport system ATP-binding protein
MTTGDIAVRAERLGKRYRIGALAERNLTLRDTVNGFMRSPGQRMRRLFRPPGEDELIWAVRDVSFELQRGSVLGIIGRNGAGKSTLLKILSRITEPTEGYADVHGRLASLLEVGTGFHGELTGRDNVYLNGAILGMRRAEVSTKFDDIVEFAGVQKFIDTPVKRYSSGMYMRLAFAVAAHLEPDILIVDEVLSVGDAEFQQKSLGKMREVTGAGRTVLFVSHNMAAVRSLCDRAILLSEGRVVADGAVDRIVTDYLSAHVKAEDHGEIPADVERIGSGEARFSRIRMLDSDAAELSEIRLGQPFTVALELEVTHPIPDAFFEIGISSLEGIRVASSLSTDEGGPHIELASGLVQVALDVNVVLLPGHYTLDIAVHHGLGGGYTIDALERILDFEALNFGAESQDTYSLGTVRGYVRPAGRWRVTSASDVATSRVR